MHKPKVFVSDYVHPSLLTRLTEVGYDLDYLPNISYKQFLAIIKNYQGFVINSKIKMNRAAIDKLDSALFIARLGSGLDIIDLEAAAEKNIAVYSAPEGNRNAVAEHAVGMLLSLFNNLRTAHNSVLDFSWERELNRGTEIEGKTIGIIGYGNTGSAFASKWAGWDVNVLVYDKYESGFADSDSYITECDLETLLTKSDVISIHLQLTDETDMMVNDAFLSKMKKNSVLINTSRGKIVDTAALHRALRSGHLSGCCLDVLEIERMNQLNNATKTLYNSLFNMNNVILSPHIAGWTHKSLEKIANVLADKIINKP